MGFARTYAVALLGLNGHVVEVEADVGGTLPSFVLLGLPDATLKESRERIRSAAKNSGAPLTPRKATVSLTPATLPKTGSGFDLAILIAALQASGRCGASGDCVFLSELGLDGSLRPVSGVFPAVSAVVRAGHRKVVLASENLPEAELVPGAEAHGFEALSEVLEWLGADPTHLVKPPVRREVPEDEPVVRPRADLADVVGQAEGRWALEIAAAGGHHLSMIGPPGSGKTMLAERLPGILPPLDAQATHEVTAVHSVGNQNSRVRRLITEPPWEAPHHTASAAAIVGGGSGILQPGAASRAHHGVLFLDEAPEFRRGVLDALRQPLESGWVMIDRARASARYPAQFQLVLAANPCPCGRTGGMGSRCTCSSRARRAYLAKLSGPLMDRVDLRIAVPKLSAADLATRQRAETSAEVLSRVTEARRIARERLAPWGISTNAQLRGTHLRNELRLPDAALASLTRLLDRGETTLRGCDRIQRVAWTLADLDGCGTPRAEHVDAAIGLRMKAGAFS